MTKYHHYDNENLLPSSSSMTSIRIQSRPRRWILFYYTMILWFYSQYYNNNDVGEQHHTTKFLFFVNAASESATSIKPFTTSSSSILMNNNVKSGKKGARTTGVGSKHRKRSIFHSSYATATTSTTKATQTSKKKKKLFIQKRPEHNDVLFYIVNNENKEEEEIVISLSSSSSATHQLHQQQQYLQIQYVKNNHSNTEDEASTKTKKKNKKNSQNNNNKNKMIEIEGIYGIYNLPSGPHLVIIYESENVYECCGNSNSNSHLLNIHKVNKMEILPLNTNPKQHSAILKSLSEKQKKEEERQLRLLRKAFREHDLYYTPIHYYYDNNNHTGYCDFTHTLQRTYCRQQQQQQDEGSTNTTSSSPSSLLFQGSDSRFFWNEELVKPLMMKQQDIPNNNNNTANTTETTKDTMPITAQKELLKWIIPCTSAFVGISQNVSLLAPPPHNEVKATINSSTLTDTTALALQQQQYYDLLLISRRSRYRVGTRFTRRGCDAFGRCANFVETEQIAILPSSSSSSSHTEIYSHVQTRGSIPLHWSSPSDIKTYAPRVRIGINPLSQARALYKHLSECLYLYKHPIVFCNLVDKKKDQGRLGKAFDSVLKAVLEVYFLHHHEDENEEDTTNNNNKKNKSNGLIQHIWYDFHAECSKGRWHKGLKYLLEHHLRKHIETQKYFSMSLTTNNNNNNNRKKKKEKGALLDFNIHSKQQGVIRTNCMDCLDRTNVVQSLIGRYILFQQMNSRDAQQTQTTTRKRNLPFEYLIIFRKNPLTLPWGQQQQLQQQQQQQTTLSNNNNGTNDSKQRTNNNSQQQQNNNNKEGELTFRQIWADNADLISNLYAGTNALKGDFTRTGKRTKRGMLDDGVNSVTRYYLNNFGSDSQRQEGYDLLVGSQGFIMEDASSNIIGRNENEDGGEELHRARIKYKPSSSSSSFNKQRRKKQGGLSLSSSTNNALSPEHHTLDLRWLPGDLKSHTLSSNTKKEAQALLAAIDRRATTDKPWWVIDDSDGEGEGKGSSDFGSSQTFSSSPSSSQSASESNSHDQAVVMSISDRFTHGQYGALVVMGAVYASLKAPIITAGAILLILGPGLSSISNNNGRSNKE